VWTFMSDLGTELIPTSTSLCPDLRTGWWKIWFFLRINADASLPKFTGIRPIPQPIQGYGVARKDLCSLPSVDLFQPLGSTAPSAGDDHVDISRTKLSRPSLLRVVGQYGDQHLDMKGPSLWGHSESWHWPHPLKGRSR
jgi:hypothetical protein